LGLVLSFFGPYKGHFLQFCYKFELKAVIHFFTVGDAIKIPLNQIKLFSFTPEDFMITLQKLHAYVIKNNKHTFYIIHTHFIWKRKYMHTLMDDLYTQRLLIFALFATAAYFLIFYNYKQKVCEALEMNTK